jgi:hypothetical protein
MCASTRNGKLIYRLILYRTLEAGLPGLQRFHLTHRKPSPQQEPELVPRSFIVAIEQRHRHADTSRHH